MKTKYIYVHQSNSGGYTIKDTKLGIGQEMIFEVNDDISVADHLMRLDEAYDGNLFEYCECCGERWDSYYYEEITTDIKSFMDDKTSRCAWLYSGEKCYIHKIDGSFEELVLEVYIDPTRTFSSPIKPASEETIQKLALLLDSQIEHTNSISDISKQIISKIKGEQ